jgi:nucleoside-diphosphate-sugar epimerase
VDLYAALLAGKSRPRVVHLSSMTVYGSAIGKIDEDTELHADLGPYSSAQRDAERLAGNYDNAVILRPGGEYGPGCPHWTLRIARLLLARRLGDLGAAGDGCCNLLYIDDLVTAILQALRIPEVTGQCFNLAVATPPTWNEYFIDFARALRAVPVRRISHRWLRIESNLLGPVLKATEMALNLARLPASGLPPPISPSLLALCRQEIQLQVSRAERLLGLRWTGVSVGLEGASAWCRHILGQASLEQPS